MPSRQQSKSVRIVKNRLTNELSHPIDMPSLIGGIWTIHGYKSTRNFPFIKLKPIYNQAVCMSSQHFDNRTMTIIHEINTTSTVR